LIMTHLATIFQDRTIVIPTKYGAHLSEPKSPAGRQAPDELLRLRL
jgi:hypothetical protein